MSQHTLTLLRFTYKKLKEKLTVSDSKKLFHEKFPYVIPGLYKRIVDEMLVELNLLNHQNEFKQDYLFLIEYSRLLGLMVSKASSMSLMMKVSTLLDETLNNEMDLHISFCSKFGISRKEILETHAAPITMGYTNFLLRIAYENTFAEMLISLFPCQWGYYELGRELYSENKLQNNYVALG